MDIPTVQTFASAAAPSLPRDAQATPYEDAQLLAAIVQYSEDAIIAESPEGIVMSWNDGAAKMFGYRKDEIVGQSVSTLHDSESGDEFAHSLDLIRRGKTASHFETIRRRKDGSRIHVSISLAPLRNEQGTVIGAAKIIRDITELKNAELRLRRAEKLAIAGRLASSVAHEINNPLAALTNLLYLIGCEKISPEVEELRAMAERELSRISHITTQALGFYKENSSAAEHDLAEIIEDALALQAHRMAGVSIKKRYFTGTQLVCRGGELRQVFVNLIGNAVDTLANAGVLTLRVRRASSLKDSKPGVRFTIADSGSGMSAEVLQHLFEPFFSTKGATSTGLGLWMCQQIVARHDGNMRVKSRQLPGIHGTVVSVFLPV